MAPKHGAPEHFEVDGVKCTLGKGVISVGCNAGLPRQLRFPIRAKATDSLFEAAAKVRQHQKFSAVAAAVAGMGANSSGTNIDAPQPGKLAMLAPSLSLFLRFQRTPVALTSPFQIWQEREAMASQRLSERPQVSSLLAPCFERTTHTSSRPPIALHAHECPRLTVC